MAEPGNSQRIPHSAHPKLSADKKLDLYKTAYEEGKRALQDQLGDLSNLRLRATQIMTLVSSATAFLVGTTLTVRGDRTPSAAFSGLSIALTVADAVALVCLVIILASIVVILKPYTPVTNMTPARRGIQTAKWKRGVGPQQLVLGWVDPEIGGKDETSYYRALALSYGDFLAQNTQYIRQLWRAYYVLMLTSLGALLGWVAVIVYFAYN